MWIVRAARRAGDSGGEALQSLPVPKALGWIVLGLIVLALGSRVLVENAVVVARGLGVSEAIIGLTIIAAGTSMPELATSAVGAWRGQSDIAMGNVIGSNIFNLLFVMGLAACIHPITGVAVRGVDSVFFVLTAAWLWWAAWTGRTVGRGEGAGCLVIYAAYLLLMWPRS
ncbi:Ca2+/Na+ antiporter [Haloferula luteola]|uniref:Ca2+/Na+ antiporter n=1 Tax=Haloferula luteola TaxID=595692 RepID=A0A840V0C4_9BACT|nr:Ca2+/Na+ antiporter [Haloferula luteola]